MRVLVLSHFDSILGPKLFLKAPKSIEDKEIEKIPPLMDVYDVGFFIHISGDIKSANLIFEIPSEQARGRKEILQISIVSDINSEINLNLARELLESFVMHFKQIKNAFKAFYVKSNSSVEFEVFREVEHLFNDSYRSFIPAVKALKEAELRYQALFKSARDAILIIDNKTANILDLNEQAEKILGISKDDIIGLNVSEIHFTDEYQKIRKQILELTMREDPLPIEITVKNFKGKVVPIEANASRIKIGEQSYMQAIFRDITQRKQQERKLIETEKILKQGVKELSCLFEITKLIEKPNISVREIIQNTIELIPNALQFPKLACSRIIYDNIEYKTENFKETEWKISTHVKINEKLLDVEVIYFEEKQFLDEEIYLLYDIASRLKSVIESKKTQKKLIKSEEKYREAFNRANFYKDLFAHDMNNILNNLMSSTELLSMYIQDPKIKGNKNEMLSILKEQVNRGSRLINTVQKLSTIEEDNLLIESIELCGILKKAIHLLKQSFTERIVNVSVDALEKNIYVKANELLLDIFENLLTNAAKYNDNPFVVIQIKISEIIKSEINYLKIECIDNGIGISDKRKEIIFEKGYKSEKGKKGMGLGLSLVKSIIDSYNGQIWIEDKVKGDPSRGSNFILLIPKA